MSSEDLTAAAERAREVLPETLAELVHNELHEAMRGPDGYPADDLPWAHRIAAEVLALPAPVPAVDRDAVAAMLRDASDSHKTASGLTWSRHMAAVLLARGLRLPAKSASQVELAARLRDMSYRGVQMSQPEAMVYADDVLSAFDVRVPAEEGDDHVSRR
jgi:hypothetical protein